MPRTPSLAFTTNSATSRASVTTSCAIAQIYCEILCRTDAQELDQLDCPLPPVAFAENLARQVREFSDPGREVKVTIGGDGGRVLKFEGDLSAEQAERLTAALRADLKEVGFKRVEVDAPEKWWVRV